MNNMNELIIIAKEHSGIIETKTAAERVASKNMLYKLCKENIIHRVARGQYILPGELLNELLSISKRSNQVIFPMKPLCSSMAFRHAQRLNIPLQPLPDARLLCQSRQSASYTMSNQSCSILAGLL